MRYFFHTCVLLLFCIPVLAQQNIQGVVVNASTGIPIPGASVFISNTSKGATTNANGEFLLTNVPIGKHNLVISNIGYETNVFPFSEAKLPLRIKVELTMKVKELENVVVEHSIEEGWDKWGKTFMDYFVGTTANAADCSIKNEKAIKFRYFKRSNRVKAYADEPIILENKALGYIVKYQLEEFEVNFTEETFVFLGYTLFEKMQSTNKTRLAYWRKNRKAAYRGSILDFMRSLYNNKLEQNGFEVLRAKRVPNVEKERVKELYKMARARKGGGTAAIDLGTVFSSYPDDSINYFQTVLQQKDYTEFLGRELLTADSLLLRSEGESKTLYFENYIYVLYTIELAEEGFVKTIYPPVKAAEQQSYATLLNGDAISIDKLGNYYNPRSFSTSSYWSWSEKMANMLPIDYDPKDDD